MLSFKSAFSLSSFTFIKRLFSSSSLSAIRVVSSAYLRLLIFLPEILIPGYESSCLAFHMIYSQFSSVAQLCPPLLQPHGLQQYIQSTSREMLDWMKHKLESRLPGEISTTSAIQITPLMTETEEDLKSLLMKVKEESEKADLKLRIQEMKIMASGSITLCQIDGETMVTVTDFIVLSSKITADGDCSHEIKRCFLLGRKVMTNLLLLLSHFSRVRLHVTP